MFQRCSVLVCLFVAFFALPLEARCKEKKGGIKDINRRIEIPLGEADTWRSFAVVELMPASNDVSVARVCHEVFLASTPGGSFCVCFDLQVALMRSGPGVSLTWYPREGVAWSLRVDLFYGGIVSSTWYKLDDQ
jgi:hypothetical protein